jgi:glycosyltransferase involved in cell wall biosynthesis
VGTKKDKQSAIEHLPPPYVRPKLAVAHGGWHAWLPDLSRPAGDLGARADAGAYLPYPLNLTPERTRHGAPLDPTGVPYVAGKTPGDSVFHPIMIAHYGLAQWNAYLQSGSLEAHTAFLAQARWLLANEIELPDGGGGWPVPVPHPGYSAYRPWLSTLAQSSAISLLLRAYQLTGEASYLEAASRAAGTLTRDILDGGVTAPMGDDGLIFEEVAVYPAAHIFSGFLQTFIGIYDGLAFGIPVDLAPVLEVAHDTLHRLLPQYDAGYWTRNDLQRDRLATAQHHRLHVMLLEICARFSGCARCARTAHRWRAYQGQPLAFARRRLALLGMRVRQMAAAPLRLLSTRRQAAPTKELLRVCVPITAYPFAGGMRAVLAGWRQAMANDWQMEFLTRRIGLQTQGERIYSFELKFRPLGKETSTPSQFPNVIFYVVAGWRGVRRLLRRTTDYALLLPQDGIMTALFTVAGARFAGKRIVTVDHGNIFALFDPGWRQEQIEALRSLPRGRRWLKRARLGLYWPTLKVLARLATRGSDFFLVASDDIADAYQRHLGVPAHRIARFPFLVDTHRFAPVEATARLAARARLGIQADAILITMINRLSPEKDMPTALRALRQTVDSLPPDLRSRVRILLAGDGPQRAWVERELQQCGFEDICRLWGEASSDDVAQLLAISDIFLFTAKRSINSMAVLEAMAAGCAVVGTTCTRHIAEYLDADRGISVPVGDHVAIANALERLIVDEELRRRSGGQARAYVTRCHTDEALRRCLLRATLFTPVLPAGEPAMVGRASGAPGAL